MTDPDTISADYTLRPSELAATLALLVEARQPTLVWGPPGTAKSMIAQQVAADAGRQYVDVRALLLDPVDLRGIPWRDGADRTRWAPPAFLPPTDDPGRWLINLEELPSAVQMVQAALYQLVLDRKVSTVDWRTLLRRYMTDASKSDYSWSLPNRRFIDSGLYLPSIRSEGIDTIAVIVDTSGSLPARTLAEFWAEVREVTAELQPERVILLQVDAAVQDTAEYAASDLPDEIAIRGRGGTDFRPGFAWLEEHDIRPGVCLYLTDMLCSSYPETAPPFDVIWCNWSAPPGDWNREPWGERIDIGTSSGAAP